MKWLPLNCCISNIDVLTKIIKSNQYIFLGTEQQLKASYYAYIDMGGRTEIIPMSLSIAQAKLLKTAYSSRAKKYDLGWIDGLYINGLLSCPICGGEGPRTIEHYLPKEWYPEFAVFSYNLIPSCGTCNSKRGSYNRPLQQLPVLHPYFDADILSTLVLEVDISIAMGVPEFTLVFNAYAFPADHQRRIDAHIKTCIDMPAFRSKCSGFMTEYGLTKKHNGVRYLSNYLIMRLNILERGGNQNCWESALIRGMKRRPDIAAQIIARMR